MSAEPTTAGYHWTYDGPHEPLFNPTGQRVCEVPGCTRKHVSKGLCAMHRKRTKLTGDPMVASRFATEEEKRAFVARERAERKAMRERYWRDRQLDAAGRRALGEAARRRIRPEAKALVAALDTMPEAERAAIAAVVVGALLGRDVDLATSTASTRHNHDSEGVTS
ncbi:hypothetical protein GCM10009721_06240 [Terrabacter tumescens]|uniref:Uncharacterized protein n=1 Tax=Terrabacter tumescens TaxID=60443 RepID=A0ABQ2HKF1_9MICO|nr:hypothetical protein [Terrabacter tumescens]GGM84249.1 hypothetical protein GCM10009721_06240 [Terrabacter tumescens]